MNNPDHIFFFELRNHFFFWFFGVKILKFFDADPGSGMETVRIRDPGWKKVGSGIRYKHPGSATLMKRTQIFFGLLIFMENLILDSDLYEQSRPKNKGKKIKLKYVPVHRYGDVHQIEIFRKLRKFFWVCHTSTFGIRTGSRI